MKSQIRVTGIIDKWPVVKNQRIYMQEFTQKAGLPNGMKIWQPIVDEMLFGIETDGPIYLMVDQGNVKRGQTLRRPGPHIDGHWVPGKYAHGNPSPGHSNPPDRHQQPGRHCLPYDGKELILLTSNFYGCDALVGEYEGEFGEGGECGGMMWKGMFREKMRDNHIYTGDVYTVHEAIPSLAEGHRTVVRLNVPGVALNS